MGSKNNQEGPVGQANLILSLFFVNETARREIEGFIQEQKEQGERERVEEEMRQKWVKEHFYCDDDDDGWVSTSEIWCTDDIDGDLDNPINLENEDMD